MVRRESRHEASHDQCLGLLQSLTGNPNQFPPLECRGRRIAPAFFYAPLRNPFRGTVQPNSFVNQSDAKLKTIEAMLSSPNTSQNPVPKASLSAECSVYTRYLTDQEPDRYIRQKYAEAFEPGRPLVNRSNSRFDSLIEKVSIKNTLFTRAIDGYCKLFYRSSMVRKKLVLLLAILETQTMTVQKIDVADAKNPPILLLTFLTQITRSVLLLLAATILLSPVRLAMSCFERTTET